MDRLVTPGGINKRAPRCLYVKRASPSFHIDKHPSSPYSRLMRHPLSLYFSLNFQYYVIDKCLNLYIMWPSPLFIYANFSCTRALFRGNGKWPDTLRRRLWRKR